MSGNAMTYIIAEAGIAHGGKASEAFKLVDAAFDAGADCVKFQLYHADAMVRDNGQRGILKSCELAVEHYRALKDYADDLGIDFLLSCFDLKAVDVAMGLGLTKIKVGSGELTNHALLKHIGEHKRELILSTGMSTMDDIFRGVGAFKDAGGVTLTLLHCVSLYPTPTEHANLRAMHTLRRNFFCPIGFSDHTASFDAMVAAVAIGAAIIERHIMHNPFCVDAVVSLMPDGFRAYVATARRTEKMMGHGEKILMPGEDEMQVISRNRWHVPPDSEA